MDRMKLTATNVARLKLPKGMSDKIWFDERMPRFGFRLRGAGNPGKWIVQYKFDGQERRDVLGSLSTMDADKAWHVARAKLGKVDEGIDPRGEEDERRASEALTFKATVERYLARAKERVARWETEGEASKLRRLTRNSYTEIERYLLRHWSPLHGLPLAKITRAHIAARLAEIEEGTGAPELGRGAYAAARAKTAINSLFMWAMTKGLRELGTNPVLGTEVELVEKARKRTLDEDELRAVWQCSDENTDYGRIIRLIILTACRRDEIGAMSWSELDLDEGTMSLPARRTKNGKPFLVPLAPEAVRILKATPKRDGREFVFGRGEGSFSGWAKGKDNLDARLEKALGRKVEPWRVHDLRRTTSTGLAALGVPSHVRERVLNHAKPQLEGVYDLHEYEAEKRQALDRWADHVEALVSGVASNVVTMPRRA